MSFLDSLNASDIRELFVSGQVSAKEIVDATYTALAAREPQVQAFLELSQDLAYAQAEKLDAARTGGEELGPLAAVPVAFKDNLNLVGTHTTCASRMLENYQSPYSATCVTRMIDAGALPIGKTNMDEFAFGSSTETSAFHKTSNPWDFERVPGGSSGGSAAAVASGEITLALGSDTGGSIRQPASLCGVYGMKPTYGAVSRYGVVAFGSSLDQVGPFARTVADVASCLDALTRAGKDPLDSTSQDCKGNYHAYLTRGVLGLKVGVVPALMSMEGVSDEVRGALRQAQDVLSAQGAKLVEIELPHIDSAIAAYYVIAPCEAFSNLARFDGVRYGYQEPNCATLAEQTALSRAHGFGEEAKRRQMLGAYLLASGVYDEYYYRAQQARTLITQDYKDAFETCDIILMPTSPRSAWKFGEISNPTQMYAADTFTISSNIAGNCALSVPMGLGCDSQLPVSVQLQGPAFSDGVLLQVAQVFENNIDMGCGVGKGAAVAPAVRWQGGELA